MIRQAFSLSVMVSLLVAQPADRLRGSGYESISKRDLRAHLRFLASDELEGRETTYRGQKIAAQYIAAAFEKLGLKPIGQDGTYFQHFPLSIVKPSDQTTMTLHNASTSKSYSFGKDFLTIATIETTLTAPAVFVGFMDALPEGVDVAGKVVVAFAGRTTENRDVGRRRPFMTYFPGSAATIGILDEASDGSLRDLEVRFANQIEKGEMSLTYQPPDRGFGRLHVFTVTSVVGAELLAQFNRPLATLRQEVLSAPEFQPVPLKDISVSVDVRVVRESATSENVVGLLEGSDPVLKYEYVVLTAHYDHVGISARTGEIYNGADDDGSGTSMILELAEAFVLNEVRPKRSIVFMTVAGEEKGLLGSRYYSDFPLVPLERTAANINIDMIGRTDHKYEELNNPDYVYVIGSDKISTDLDSLLHVANRNSVNFILDYRYNDDHEPNQFYRRSDHYNFARKGIPVVFFFTGLHDDYHRPTDTVEKIEFDKMTRIGRLIYFTTWEVADFNSTLKQNARPSVSFER